MPLFAAMLAAAAVPAQSPYQMTSAEVQQCGARVVERNRRIAALKQRDADLATAQAAMAARQTQLSAMAAGIDKTKKKDVANYNAMSSAYNTDVAALHDRIAARNAENGEIPALIDAYNAACAHRSMNPADVAALPEDQRTAMLAGAKTTTIMVPAPAPTRRRR